MTSPPAPNFGVAGSNLARGRISQTAPASRQVARQREQAQAAPRPSRIRMSVKVRGVGETRLPLVFNAYLLDEPTVSFGCVAEVPLAFGELPLATATVVSWNKTHGGFFQGAVMGFRVESGRSDIVVSFSLTFEGSTLRSQSLGGSTGGHTTGGVVTG